MSYKISGIVDNGGTLVSGSTVRLFNQTQNEYVGKRLSNASGEYEFLLEDPNVEMVGLQFDGSDDYISISNSPSLQITGDLTIAFWIYPHQFGTRRTFIDKAYGGEYTLNLEPSFNGFNFYRGTAGSNSPPYSEINSPSISLNTWLHATVTVSGTTATWYFDGQPVATKTDSVFVGSASSNPVKIGDGYTSGHLDGVLSELSFWNRALSQSEIQDLMNTQLCGDETGLNAYYRLDDTSGGTVQDYSQNTNTGTIVSAPFTTNTGINLTQCGGVDPTNDFHVVCEWEDSGTFYNSLSYPYVKPEEVV